MFKNKMRKGFSLIEMMVVVIVVGILSSIALPQYQQAVGKSRTNEAIATLGMIISAQDQYYVRKGQYTSDLSQLPLDIPDSEWYGYNCFGADGAGSARTCTAYPKKQSNILPTFEFHSQYGQNHAISSYSGKRWCIASPKNTVAYKICSGMGTLYMGSDPQYFDMDKS